MILLILTYNRPSVVVRLLLFFGRFLVGFSVVFGGFGEFVEYYPLMIYLTIFLDVRNPPHVR